jgi:hypothetical protein
MHGLVFAEFEKFVSKSHGPDAWRRVLAHAGTAPQMYVAIGTYPDSELIKLVEAACAVTKKPSAQLLEAFGESITPTLLSMYRAVIVPTWRTLDLVEQTEHVIHTVVRSRGGTPPVLSAKRVDATHLVVNYGSQRKLCALARGIVRGIARHYHESVSISEPSCMLAGAKSCRLEITLNASAQAPGATDA